MDQNMLVTIFGFITMVGGAWLTIKKVSDGFKKDHNNRKKEILQEAKEELALKEKDFSNKIELLEARIDALENSVNKDISHLKQVYENDMRVLADKIELLREELREQSSKTLDLLSKMIKN